MAESARLTQPAFSSLPVVLSIEGIFSAHQQKAADPWGIPPERSAAHLAGTLSVYNSTFAFPALSRFAVRPVLSPSARPESKPHLSSTATSQDRFTAVISR